MKKLDLKSCVCSHCGSCGNTPREVGQGLRTPSEFEEQPGVEAQGFRTCDTASLRVVAKRVKLIFFFVFRFYVFLVNPVVVACEVTIFWDPWLKLNHSNRRRSPRKSFQKGAPEGRVCVLIDFLNILTSTVESV